MENKIGKINFSQCMGAHIGMEVSQLTGSDPVTVSGRTKIQHTMLGGTYNKLTQQDKKQTSSQTGGSDCKTPTTSSDSFPSVDVFDWSHWFSSTPRGPLTGPA